MENLFFQLLQVAIGNRKELSHIPTATEWTELFALSKKQALTAIAFAGVNRLRGGGDFGYALDIPEMLYLKWLGLTAKIQKWNQELNAECAKVCKEFVHDGVLCVVLKGQSNLVYYPEDLREARTAGDIDLWCDVPDGIEVAHDVDGTIEKREYKGIEGVIEYCKQYERCQGREIPWHRVLYYHCEVTSPSGIGIEPHYRPSYMCSPLRNWRLQRWFRENRESSESIVQACLSILSVERSSWWKRHPSGCRAAESRSRKTIVNEPFGVCDFETNTIKTSEGIMSNKVSEIVCKHPSSASLSSMDSDAASSMPSGKKHEINRSGVIPVPTVSFNAVYQLCHIYRHLFDEGIGLRQLLDYYFVLRALHIEQGELADRAESMAQWAEGMGIAVTSNKEIMHTLGRFGMAKFAGAVMWVLAQVFDSETKTIKTPSSMAGSTNLSLEESSVASENKLSASTANSSNGILTDAAIADGKKQSINHSLVVTDWQTRWPWMICEPNEKEGKFLLNEIMQAGNFGKYDTRISHSTSQMGHAWEKLKHNFRLIRHYPEEVLWEPFFRVYHYLWRRFSLWRY